MATIYSSNGPFGVNEFYEVFADEGGEEVRFVGQTLFADEMIDADMASDYDKVDALRWHEIVLDDWDDDDWDDDQHAYHMGVLAKLREGTDALR